MNRQSETAKLPVLPVTVCMLGCFAVGPNVLSQESKPNCELSVAVKVWNEAGGTR